MQTADHPRRDNDAMTVFLSHSTKDGDFVEKLAIALEASGFTPWLCETSIEPAANWVEEIDKGLKAAHLVLLVWSPDAAASYATGLEWTSALAREIAEKRLRLGIVMLRDCELPELLRTRQYIDASKDSDKAIAAVLDWLKGRRDLGRLAGDYAPVYLEGYPQDDLFVGRVSYLVQLRTVFSEGPARFLLHGEPGTGKSTLAMRFAWEAQKDFDAVVFQRCGQRSVGEIAGELAYKLRGQLGEQVLQLPPAKKLEAAADWLRARQSLLVLDDVWPAEVKQIEPGGPCSVLHTSRQQSLPWISAGHTSEVVSFSNEECQSLFHASLDKDFGAAEITQHRETLLGFAARVERLPIAVAVGASLLREKSASALGRAVLKLRLEELRDGVQDVPGLFRTAIESQPEREQRLLAACGMCVQEGFWLPLAAEIAALSEDKAGDAADWLVHSSLLRVIDRERRRFQLHSLLREQVRARQGGDGVGKLQEYHAAALEKLFKDWETRWQECRECLEEVIPAAQLLWNRGESDRYWQLSLLGYETGRRIGELDVALRIMKQEETLWMGRHDHEAKIDLQACYGNQALILQAWGRLEEALALHKKEEAICLELGNKGGLSTSYGNQANILYAWGRLEEALALHKKKEAICLEFGSRDGLSNSYGNQAGILSTWGRLDEAMALLKKQEAIALELGNKDGLQLSYSNQALILQAWGRLDEAMALHKKQEAICLELGNKNGLQASYCNQGAILKDWGRLEEAMALHKKQEAICLELGNKDSLAISYGDQALILKAWGRLEEAMALHKKQEAICLELGNKSGLGMCYWQWGLLARAQGDRKTEKEKLEQALAIFTELKMPRERDAVLAELGAPHPNRTQIGGPGRHSAPVAVSAQASTPHPAADPERAYRLSLAYQQEKARWMALPWWKRQTTKKPEPPKGI